MIKSKFKRVTSLFLATLMCVTTFAGIGSTTAYAASGEKADVYMVDFPRDGDANYDGVWGHSNLTLKNGWHTGRSNFTNLKAIGSYSGIVCHFGYGIFANTKSLNHNFAVLICFKCHIITVCSGYSERKTFNLTI
jgi:hypothetical protein